MSPDVHSESDTIRTEVARLCSTEPFRRAPVLANLLTYISSHQAAGGPPLKAYTIAVEALGRPPEFDAQIDSYPRVMMGRLRRLIDVGYARDPGPGLRIGIPTGQYRIVLLEAPAALRDPPPAPAEPVATDAPPRRRGRGRIAAGAVALLALAILAAFAAWRSGGVHGSAVQPPPLLALAVPRTDGSAAAMRTARLVDDRWREGFSNFGLIRLAADRASEAGEVGEPADYRLTTSLAGDGDAVSAFVALDRVRDSQTIWSSRFRVVGDPAAAIAMNRTFNAIAGGLGVIVADQRATGPATLRPGMPCLVAYNGWRIGRITAEMKPARECLARTIAAKPADVQANAAASFMDLIAGETAGDRGLIANGHRLAGEAYRADPLSPDALMAAARSRFYNGECGAGRRLAERAVAANPLDTDIASFTGAYLAACDDPRAEPALRRALELSGPGGTIAGGALALLLIRQGRADEAAALVDGIAPTTGAEAQFALIRLLVRARGGDRRQARAEWAALARRYRLSPDSEPNLIVRQFQTLPPLRSRIITELRRSGVVA